MFSIFVSTLLVERLVETICVQMFFFSFTVSGLTPMGGMIDEQPLQSASVNGSMKSSDSVIDASHVEFAHHQRRF